MEGRPAPRRTPARRLGPLVDPLAPAVAALVGMGAAELWQRRERSWATIGLAFAMAATSVCSFHCCSILPD